MENYLREWKCLIFKLITLKMLHRLVMALETHSFRITFVDAGN